MAKAKIVIGKKKRKQPQAARPKVKPQEYTRLGAALRTLGGLGGGALGSMVGMSGSGASFGSGIGGALSKWLGSGDYTVTSNSITQKASVGMIPAMHKEGQSIVVRHREFLTEIRGATAFTVRNEFNLNPGLSTTFPWLSGLASQYSQYKIKGLVYHYIPTSGNAVSSTNAALGTVMIQTSYRATEPVPSSKIEMLNEYWASESKPSEEFCHPIECNPKENPFNVQYIRTGTLPATENQLMYDLGRTTVAVSGQQANGTVLGDLWVTYEIELKKPVLTNINNTDIQTFGATSVTNINNTTCLGTDMVSRFSTMPASCSANGNVISFGRGTVGAYSIVVYWSTVSGCAGFSATVTAGTATVLPVVANALAVGPVYSTGSGTAIATCYLQITDPDVATELTLGMTALVSSNRCWLVITEINPALRVNT